MMKKIYKLSLKGKGILREENSMMSAHCRVGTSKSTELDKLGGLIHFPPSECLFGAESS